MHHITAVKHVEQGDDLIPFITKPTADRRVDHLLKDGVITASN